MEITVVFNGQKIKMTLPRIETMFVVGSFSDAIATMGAQTLVIWSLFIGFCVNSVQIWFLYN